MSLFPLSRLCLLAKSSSKRPMLMFSFRGSPYHPDLAFDKTAEALAHNGRCFVQRMFRLEDLQVYMMRLFLEYAVSVSVGLSR